MNYPYQFSSTNLLDEIKKFFTNKSALSILILINIIVWVIIQFLKVFAFFLNDPNGDIINALVMHTVALPANLPSLLGTPWSVITYNFLHIDFFHILFNMIWLYWFGRIFLEFLKPVQLVWVYLLGGITGGLIYVAAFNTFPVFSQILPVSCALGASASVMAIVTAISFYVPAYSIHLLFIGKVRIGYLALFLFIFDFFMIPSGNSGGHIAHIGGVLCGFLYTLIYLKSSRILRHNTTTHIPSFFTNWFKNNKSRRVDDFSSKRPVSDDEYNLNRKNNQKKIDEILDKISKGGYESLTREEKDFLFRSSKKS